MLDHARKNPHASFIPVPRSLGDNNYASSGGQKIVYRREDGKDDSFTSEMVVLCPAMVGSEDAAKLGEMMDLTLGGPDSSTS